MRKVVIIGALILIALFLAGKIPTDIGPTNNFDNRVKPLGPGCYYEWPTGKQICEEWRKGPGQ